MCERKRETVKGRQFEGVKTNESRETVGESEREKIIPINEIDTLWQIPRAIIMCELSEKLMEGEGIT